MIGDWTDKRNPSSAFVLGINYLGDAEDQSSSLLDELCDLVEALGISVRLREMIPLKRPSPRYLLGIGKFQNIVEEAKANDCGCIVFDAALSPGQQRNWEAQSGICVIDRQEVILEIFAQRAKTKEAVLQVELARMEYSLPRLRRAWTHLNRQRGGGVTQRGEGEAQIEIDQRLVRNRISHLRKDLERVVKQRSTQRKRRLRVPVPTAALVGYTNAGKTSLLNRLARSQLYVKNKLFATLDPTIRRITLPSGRDLLLTDTVGFIRNLPHQIVEAFKATLEEAVVSDILIHVLDVNNPDLESHRETTLKILKDLGAEDKPMLTVYNKIDLFDEDQIQDQGNLDIRGGVNFSAQTGEGENELLLKLDHTLEDEAQFFELLLPHSRYDLVNRLYKMGTIKNSNVIDAGVHIKGTISYRLYPQFAKYAARQGLEP
tara:strand:+ start:49043 stop:50335 length:1293 start_codon:yes stop_codon:yes gene_type:complete